MTMTTEEQQIKDLQAEGFPLDVAAQRAAGAQQAAPFVEVRQYGVGYMALSAGGTYVGGGYAKVMAAGWEEAAEQVLAQERAIWEAPRLYILVDRVRMHAGEDGWVDAFDGLRAFGSPAQH
jgi:hypothetical protein